MVFASIAKAIFGSANDRQIKKYQPKVDAINALEPAMAKLSDSELKAKVQQNNQEAGAKAIELLRAGSVSNPDLQVFVDKLAGIEQQIAAEQAAIAAKKADIGVAFNVGGSAVTNCVTVLRKL